MKNLNSMYDVEECIMECWGIVEQINTLNEAVLERDISKDEVLNCLIGLSSLYSLSFEKLFSRYEKALKEVHAKNN